MFEMVQGACTFYHHSMDARQQLSNILLNFFPRALVDEIILQFILPQFLIPTPFLNDMYALWQTTVFHFDHAFAAENSHTTPSIKFESDIFRYFAEKSEEKFIVVKSEHYKILSLLGEYFVDVPIINSNSVFVSVAGQHFIADMQTGISFINKAIDNHLRTRSWPGRTSFEIAQYKQEKSNCLSLGVLFSLVERHMYNSYWEGQIKRFSDKIELTEMGIPVVNLEITDTENSVYVGGILEELYCC